MQKRLSLYFVNRSIQMLAALLIGVILNQPFIYGRPQRSPLKLTSNISGPVSPTTKIEITTSRPVETDKERLAMFLGDTDVTAICVQSDQGLVYEPHSIPFPIGESTITVYLVAKSGEWSEIARIPLVVELPKSNQPGETDNKATEKTKSPSRFQFTPAVSINTKAQSTVMFFPASSRPGRLNSVDFGSQIGLQTNFNGQSFSMQDHFDLAGASAENQALRFSELGNKAMQLDLSSYLMQYQFHKLKVNFGSISFGSNRELINSFSSRGISVALALNSRFDFSAAIMNGTSIVGFDNFFGVDKRKHQVMGAGAGIELFTKRPGALRVELNVMQGSLLPVSNFNQGSVTDAETSHGAGIRILGTDKSRRLKFDFGFARSYFSNPADPLLYQGQNVVAVRPVSRDAQYLDVSYDVIPGLKLSESTSLRIGVAYHYERVDPLYRSIGAAPQADRQNNQFDITGSLGTIIFNAGFTRSNDNLAHIQSILQTINRREAFNVSGPSQAFFGQPRSASKWLPRLSFSYDQTHQFAGFIPVNGDFTSPAQIPNQANTNQTFGAEWQLGSRARVGYHFNRSLQDNRQPGRETSDFLTSVNGVTVGLNPTKRFDVNFDVSAERSTNFEQKAINNTLRFGPALTWRMTRSMVWQLNASTTAAGDRADTNHRRDATFDIQYQWRFLVNEKSRWRKVQGQFFIRYANTYGFARDVLTSVTTFTKLQTFNAGLNFSFF